MKNSIVQEKLVIDRASSHGIWMLRPSNHSAGHQCWSLAEGWTFPLRPSANFSSATTVQSPGYWLSKKLPHILPFPKYLLFGLRRQQNTCFRWKSQCRLRITKYKRECSLLNRYFPGSYVKKPSKRILGLLKIERMRRENSKRIEGRVAAIIG